ncbi:solute carrier family 17 member 1 [Rhinolophus ferrumequinum]|nr:sodium-dependent phosphate transport protein 1-like [Rhinolophus ferrumequinum]XP_032948031.1 sodium-dependent phosphate transport protein 1-like [Rhinolophus ferrumequinum]XP_032948032.1 sodium-dependent phosphate transport protein 1-like [Rhinolophus ferrumequinum]KAF6293772.1 solute carrier family 17 member 1 [Rhinolophus ferrumequinum]
MDDQLPSRKAPSFCSLRYGLCLLLHFCNVVMMSQRMCLSLTVVAMVNSTDPHGSPNTSTKDLLDNIKNPRYNWSPKIQGVILSSILYGMLIVNIPVGYLSGIYSIRKMVSCALILSSLSSLLIPLAADAGEIPLIACRVVQGLGQGTVSVAQHMVWVKWAPPLERGRLTSLSVSGLMLGPFIALLATGFICQALGWPFVFYIFGACGCALGLSWFILFYDDPKDHPCISVDEKEFITSSLVAQVSSSGQPLPIMAMLKSLPLWAISLGCFAFSWTNHILFLYSPTFISSKLHVNMTENGLLSALPYLFSWLLGILVGQVADLFLSRNMFRVITVRKLFTTLGLLLPSLFGICLCHLSSGFHSTIIFLILASATVVFCIVGILINPLDIAPRYYGFLKGVTVLIGMTGGLTSSTLAGIILNRDPESSWPKIFFLMAAINVISLTFYLIFAKAEIQDWAKEKQHTRL